MSNEGVKLKRLAVAWLAQEDWPAWLAMDPNFQPDYQHWLRRMETTFTRLEAAGVNVVKIEIRPDDFIAWRDSDAGSQYRELLPTHQRAGYAAVKAQSMELH